MPDLKSTESFINLYISLYSKICNLKKNDTFGLLKIKEEYSEFVNKCKETNYLNVIASKEREKFLSLKTINNFSIKHKEFEKIIFHDGIIFRQHISDEKWGNFFFDKIWLERINIAKTYEDFILWEDCTKETPEKIYFKNIPSNYISDLTEKIKKQKSRLPKNKKLRKKELNVIKESTLPYLEQYQNWAEKYFFNIRNYLKFYNKKVKIQISSDRILFLLVFLENNNKMEVEIDPIIPSVNPSLPILLSRKGFQLLTMPTNFNKKSNYLHITKEDIFFEVLEIFLNIANKSDINEFFEKVFTLIGYKVKYIQEDLFLLNKINYQLGQKNPLNIKSDNNYFLLHHTHLYDEELDAALKKISKLKAKYRIKNNFYLFTFSDYSLPSDNKKIKNSNIIKVSSKQLLVLLFESNLFLFINSFIQNKILSKKKNKVNKILEQKRIGEQLISDIKNIRTGHKDYKKFENLVNNIFKYLFKDSFRQYFAEPHSIDYDGHQIRDLIISNISPIKDFWKERKKEQNAKQIVVDAKNYSTEVTKSEINDVSQYLNKKLGNFAIVVSRKEISSSGKKEQKLKFADDKLIIHLSQNDIISLILHKIHQQEIEDLLEKKIHDIIK